MINTGTNTLLFLKCVFSVFLVNFVDETIIAISFLSETEILTTIKDFVNLIVSLIIGLYWVIKTKKEKKC